MRGRGWMERDRDRQTDGGRERQIDRQRQRK